MNLPLRARITALYFAVLAVTFVSLATIADYGFRHSIETTVTEASRANLESLRSVMNRAAPKGSDEIKNELNELSGLWAGAGLLEVRDQDGRTIFQSSGFARSGKELPHASASGPTFFTTNLNKVQYRIATDTLQVDGRPFLLRAAVPTESFDQALDRFRLILKEALPALIVLASLTGYWLSGRVLHPVNEIIRTARGIGGRNLSSRLPVPRVHDELRLTETLNDMLARIEVSVQRITQFTADASHDLRTPLTLIRCNSELALRRSRTEEEYRKALTRNLVTSVETTCLVENLLTLAQADAGSSGLEFRRINLAQSLHRATDEASILAADKSIRVSACIPHTPIWVNADDLALHRVFQIVLENAVKYTPRGGGIAITANRDGGSDAEIEICDSGIGIPEKDLPHIFERFYRVDRARSRESGGTGLGLAIARTFVDLHGGTIGAQGQSSGGTAILIRLPVVTPS